ncbi:MAG TPA: amidohydrolase [Candidatus Tumulicola sp.]|nr:amidohydrolase [Candidatus Tumulicola sp.]
MATAFVNARVATLDPSTPRAGGVLVADGRVQRLLDGVPTGLPKSVHVVDCAGAAIVPGFFDCHAHLTDTGLLAGEYDFRDCQDVAAMLRRVARLDDSVLYAGNFEDHRVAEGRPPLRVELDAVAPDRPVLLTRVDGHSCVVNSSALAAVRVEALEGVERDAEGVPTGRLRGPANYKAQHDFFALIPAPARRRADERAARIALAAGMTCVHNVIVGDASLEYLEAEYRANAALPLRVIAKSCSVDVGKIRKLGGRLFGGDIFLDGSIGSRTAALGRDYCDGEGRGLLYLDRDQLFELFDEAAEADLSLGVHAIGDRAIEEAIAAWEQVIAKRGPLRTVRPAIDHFEIAAPEQIARAARCGMLLSMQPAFDHLWGGDQGMYAQRLGADRAKAMNLFKSAKQAGCVICGGSDSPVTPFSALLGIHSLVNHHVPEERFSVEEALRAYTADAAKLSFDEGRRGVLASGMDADFVVLERALEDVPRDTIKDIRVLKTIVAGEIAYSI